MLPRRYFAILATLALGALAVPGGNDPDRDGKSRDLAG
jgi:hypothetical protein